MAALQIFSGALTNVFQPSNPFLIVGENIVLDAVINIANTITPPGTAARIECYPEYTSDDPNASNTRWFRELSEEDIGNGDVRMNKVVRRFAEQGSDTPLAQGVHYLDMQFSRKHLFCRVQLRVAPGGADTCSMALFANFASKPLSAP